MLALRKYANYRLSELQSSSRCFPTHPAHVSACVFMRRLRTASIAATAAARGRRFGTMAIAHLESVLV